METQVRGINDAGVVVGSTIPATLEAPQCAFYYDGTLHSLASAGLSRTGASAVNNRGQIVGAGMLAGQTHAIMWYEGSTIDLGSFGGGTSATDVNDLGQVVGWALSPTGGDDHAFLWQNGELVDLNDLVPPASGLLLTMATGINDRGEIVGYGVGSDQTGHAYVLTPIPEPTTIVLFSALAAVVRVRRAECRFRRTRRERQRNTSRVKQVPFAMPCIREAGYAYLVLCPDAGDSG
jgi:probable HAF family extracellular repeat protein